jgi:hypothetical protein
MLRSRRRRDAQKVAKLAGAFAALDAARAQRSVAKRLRVHHATLR